MTVKLYFFGSRNLVDGDSSMIAELGSKGAALADIAKLKINIPDGFTIPTTVSQAFFDNDDWLPDDVIEAIKHAIIKIENITGKKFNDSENPLLLSVRSGAPVSMPGMMETILNLGINDKVAEALAKKYNSKKFAFDTYRRFIEMYIVAVKGVNYFQISSIMEEHKKSKNIVEDYELSADDLEKIVYELKDFYKKTFLVDFPEDPYIQLWDSIAAVFLSWNCSRAKKYRQIHKISDKLGTAVNICTMIFGNLDNNSGTGVCFTRDPSTGANVFYGEYLLNAQGEDVVAGIRTPKPLIELKSEMPHVYQQLEEISERLERYYRDLQDLEFTIEQNTLYLLQTRNAKRTAKAAFKIAVDMVHEKIISKEEAITRIVSEDFEKLLMPSLDPRAHKTVLGKGLAASPGAASGKIFFNAVEAEKQSLRGVDVILVREETSPDDISGMYVSRGLLTTRGGMTSHAAIVARQMGKCCVVGCSFLQVSQREKKITVGNCVLSEGDWITIDGSSGEVILGKVATKDALVDNDIVTFLLWAAKKTSIETWCNVDNERDAEYARKLGAKGVGLFRTERVFFEKKALSIIRKVLFSSTPFERKRFLAELLPLQIEAFEEVLLKMDELPVTFRLFDYPLKEFLPEEHEFFEITEQFKLGDDFVRARIMEYSQENILLGARGCRIGIAFPDIYEMQLEAIICASANLIKSGKKPNPRIMYPFVSFEKELLWLKNKFTNVLNVLIKKYDVVDYFNKNKIKQGIMIETPRAAIIAEKLANYADFVCIGTADLSQLTYGMSRDDASLFIRTYKQEKILNDDTFLFLDDEAVMFLISYACKSIRKKFPNLELGICAEHNLQHNSILYDNTLNINYLSCSSFRVPVSILSFAQKQLSKTE